MLSPRGNIFISTLAAKELFAREPQSIGYIKQAHERGLGDMKYDGRLLRI